MENCSNCGNPINPCSGVSGISWDAAVSACMERLGVKQNQPLSQVLSEISAAICALMDANAALTCSDIFIPGEYSNIGFVGTDATTLCDLIDSIDTRFGNILNTEISDCFGTATTLYEAIIETRAQLCEDLYTTNEWLFLPLAGNSITALQAAIKMANNAAISWYDASWNSPPYIYGLSSDGLHINGGFSTTAHQYPITFDSPTKETLAPRTDYSVLTAASTTLNQDTMKPLYFIDKTTVLSVYLPSLAAIIIDRPIVTFTAEVLGSSAGASVIYPATATTDTIQGSSSSNFSQFNFITFVGDKVSQNWKIVEFGLV